MNKFILCLLWIPLAASFYNDSSTLSPAESFRELLSDSGYPKPGGIPVLNRKIFRGRRVKIKEHPYVVSIRRNFAHYLTGTLLTKNLVITIAHPLVGVNIMELGVVVGENYADRGGVVNTVILILIHEHFNELTLKADIALLRLFENIFFRGRVKPVPLLSPHAQLEGKTAFVTGWGRCDNVGSEICLPRSSRYHRDETLDPMLRSVSFKITIPNYYCEGYERNHVKLTSGMLCTGDAREEDLVCPCLGVPGAPMVVGARLAGIASWGFGCGYAFDLPLVYTKISHYTTWILSNIIIQKRITQSNLTILFKGTKAALFAKWFNKTRLIEIPITKEPMKQLMSLDLDAKLAVMPAIVYDIRDFIEDGAFSEDKMNIIQEYKQKLIDANKWPTPLKLETKPFLSEKLSDLIQAGKDSNGLSIHMMDIE